MIRRRHPGLRPGTGRLGRVLAPLLLAAAGLTLPPLVRAIPRLDLKPYPAATAGERRWVIQLPGVLQPSTDARISANPLDWRVELIVGKEISVDCNGPRLNGSIRSETLKGWGYSIYRVGPVSVGPSTRMACPPDQGPRQAFVPIGRKPFVVPYNVSLPIVIYAPSDVQVRWRLWKAEREQREAMKL